MLVRTSTQSRYTHKNVLYKCRCKRKCVQFVPTAVGYKTDGFQSNYTRSCSQSASLQLRHFVFFHLLLPHSIQVPIYALCLSDLVRMCSVSSYICIVEIRFVQKWVLSRKGVYLGGSVISQQRIIYAYLHVDILEWMCQIVSVCAYYMELPTSAMQLPGCSVSVGWTSIVRLIGF